MQQPAGCLYKCGAEAYKPLLCSSTTGSVPCTFPVGKEAWPPQSLNPPPAQVDAGPAAQSVTLLGSLIRAT